MEHKAKLREASERIGELAREITRLRQTIERLLKEAENRKTQKPSSGLNGN